MVISARAGKVRGGGITGVLADIIKRHSTKTMHRVDGWTGPHLN